MNRHRLTLAVGLLLPAVLPALADQARRQPRVMHYESFVSQLTVNGGMSYTVALFSPTATCTYDSEIGTAGCVDEVGGGAVSFDHGCLVVTGAGACTTLLHFEEFSDLGGVSIETLCAEPQSSGGFDSLIVRVPDGSRCMAGAGVIECRPIANPQEVLRLSCAEGCPADLQPGVVCKRCVGDECVLVAR